MAETVQQAITILWQGMAGIFAVIGIIALIVYTLGRLANRS